ncbi:MAG TPA: TonB-dependent receptor, partial [Sphingobacteriaceae bacterium]
GEPLPGASIKVKGTTIATTTDVDGGFRIKGVEENAVIVVTYVGFLTQEIALNNQRILNIQLKEDQQGLNEVVVVGYGSQKKVNLTGSVSTVSAKMLTDRPITNAVGALQGAAAGVTVTRTSGKPGDEGYSIQVRGLTSVNGGNSALTIIDGAPGDLSSINPEDIESVSVLKDAAAAAIYGARAARGVVLVTTKKGKKGKPVINYNNLFGVQYRTNMPEKLPSYIESQMTREAQSNANGSGDPFSYSRYIEWIKDPNMNYSIDLGTANPSDYNYTDNVDLTRVMMRDNTPEQKHSLSLSGGGDKDTYNLSFGYYNQDGLFNKLVQDRGRRLNGRFNYNRQISNKVSFSANLSYANNLYEGPPGSGNSSIEGQSGLLYSIMNLRALYPVYVPGTTDEYATGSGLYPRTVFGGNINNKSEKLSGVFNLQAVDLLKGLKLTAMYSPGFRVDNNQTIDRKTPISSLVLHNLMGGVTGAPKLFKARNIDVTNNTQFLADYDFNLNTKHTFHLLGGFTYEYLRSDDVSGTASNLSSNDLFSFKLRDPSQLTLDENIGEWALYSYLGRLQYAFDEKYLFQADVRYDGSSKLAPDNRWRAFPSFSAAWRLGNEPWFQNLTTFFDEFKIRGSWGQLGNDALGNYDYLSSISSAAGYPFGGKSALYYREATLASALKTWETIEESNIALDLTFFKQRFNITAEYFKKINKNMLAPLTASDMLGVGLSNYNVGNLETKGWELTLGWRSQVSPTFSYYLNANLHDSKNIVTKYAGRNTVVMGNNGIIEGMPFNSIFGFVADGLFQTPEEVAAHPVQMGFARTAPGDIKYRDINGDGVINQGNGRLGDSGDLVYLGNPNPRYSYGFDLGFNWKSVDFSAFFQGVGKREFYMPANLLVPFGASWLQPFAYHLDYWTPENRDARFPRLYQAANHNRYPSTFFKANGAYMRLKNLQIGYTLPKSLTQRVKVQKARVFFSGRDLWEISKMWEKSFDPEYFNSTSGSSVYQYPLLRNYSLGINLSL